MTPRHGRIVQLHVGAISGTDDDSDLGHVDLEPGVVAMEHSNATSRTRIGSLDDVGDSLDGHGSGIEPNMAPRGGGLDARTFRRYFRERMRQSQKPYVLAVEHADRVADPEGAPAVLRQLGADVRVITFWDDLESSEAAQALAGPVRTIVLSAIARVSDAGPALRALRRTPGLAEVPALIVVAERYVTSLDPALGHDDFVLFPIVPSELYARVRQLEFRKSEFSQPERMKVGPIVIDRQAHEVTVGGRAVHLTAKEFALLAFLVEHRGIVFRREALLQRVWGVRYEGGPRTVDIHVRRLRAKLGDLLPLETLRGAGYKLRDPARSSDSASSDDRESDEGKAMVAWSAT